MRWGLLGTGSICSQFARDLPHVPGAKLTAIASRNPERASQFAEQYGFSTSYGSYEELFADPDIDIVYIGTPHTEHLSNASNAMRAGKHVLCEKPLTVFPSETEKLIEVQQQTGRYLMEAMWTWFLSPIIQAKKWIAEGRIGEVKHIKADFGYPQQFDPASRMYDPGLAGGCMLDMGVYPVALTWFLNNRMPDDIKVSGKRAPTGVDDDFSAIFDFGDHMATLGSSFRCKLHNWALIIGRDGYIAIPDFWRCKEARLFELDTCVEHFVDDREHQGFAYEAIAVQNDIASGRAQSETISLQDSLSIQLLMDEIRKRI